jgi:hypothetical protein
VFFIVLASSLEQYLWFTSEQVYTTSALPSSGVLALVLRILIEEYFLIPYHSPHEHRLSLHIQISSILLPRLTTSDKIARIPSQANVLIVTRTTQPHRSHGLVSCGRTEFLPRCYGCRNRKGSYQEEGTFFVHCRTKTHTMFADDTRLSCTPSKKSLRSASHPSTSAWASRP